MPPQTQTLALPQSQARGVNMVTPKQVAVTDKPDDIPQSNKVTMGDQTTKPITVDPANPDKVTHIGTNLPPQ